MSDFNLKFKAHKYFMFNTGKHLSFIMEITTGVVYLMEVKVP